MNTLSFRTNQARLIVAFILLAAYLLAACRSASANPATATARVQRVIAQATAMALQIRETILLDEKQATATAQDRLDRLEQASTWPVVFTDTFDDNTNEWSVGYKTSEFADATFTIADGVFRWEITPHQGFLWWNRPTIAAVIDFYISVDFRQVSGPVSAYTGLMLRQDEDGNYYLFSLRSNGDFAFDKYFNGQWLSLIDWSPSPVIQVDQTNRLEVLAEQGLFSLFVNGVWVMDYEDLKIASGLCGLLVGMDEADESVIWEFENFKLHASLPAEETLTPLVTTRPRSSYRQLSPVRIASSVGMKIVASCNLNP